MARHQFDDAETRGSAVSQGLVSPVESRVMGPVSTVAAPTRRRYIDWTRGLAVLIMIEAHALDAWTRSSSRSAPAYQYLSMLGGFAAPLFLWLAGLSLVLAAEHTFRRTGSRSTATDAIVRRGAEIFILAFLFRLQAFVVSPGSWLVTTVLARPCRSSMISRRSRP